jgi:hypothetical protein
MNSILFYNVDAMIDDPAVEFQTRLYFQFSDAVGSQREWAC